MPPDPLDPVLGSACRTAPAAEELELLPPPLCVQEALLSSGLPHHVLPHLEHHHQEQFNPTLCVNPTSTSLQQAILW